MLRAAVGQPPAVLPAIVDAQSPATVTNERRRQGLQGEILSPSQGAGDSTTDDRLSDRRHAARMSWRWASARVFHCRKALSRQCHHQFSGRGYRSESISRLGNDGQDRHAVADSWRGHRCRCRHLRSGSGVHRAASEAFATATAGSAHRPGAHHTQQAVDYVAPPTNLAATITPHHLHINRNAMFAGGLRSDFYCSSRREA